jgi:hypothetical protein
MIFVFVIKCIGRLKIDVHILNVDVNSVLGLLRHVVMGDIADVLEVHAPSSSRVEVCRLVGWLLCIYSIVFE